MDSQIILPVNMEEMEHDRGPPDVRKRSGAGKSVLADTDPIGVNSSVTFESVGGLDQRTSIC